MGSFCEHRSTVHFEFYVDSICGRRCNALTVFEGYTAVLIKVGNDCCGNDQKSGNNPFVCGYLFNSCCGKNSKKTSEIVVIFSHATINGEKATCLFFNIK